MSNGDTAVAAEVSALAAGSEARAGNVVCGVEPQRWSSISPRRAGLGQSARRVPVALWAGSGPGGVGVVCGTTKVKRL